MELGPCAPARNSYFQPMSGRPKCHGCSPPPGPQSAMLLKLGILSQFVLY